MFRSHAQKRKRQHPAMRVRLDNTEWDHDSEEEFFADYRLSRGDAFLGESYNYPELDLCIHIYASKTSISVQAPTRAQIETVFEVFERNVLSSQLPAPKDDADRPTIFIGHGRSQQWRDLKDHLSDKHSYRVEAYEIGARAGHVIRDVLEDMLSNSSFAILVMTGEDETAEGHLRARQNVIHEAGLFQGRLGFHRAIVLLEDGTEGFSNLDGLEQIRYKRGAIKETYGDILATLRREFPESGS